MQETSQSHNLRNEKMQKRSSFNTETDPVLFFHLFRKNLLWFAIIIFISIATAFLYLRYTTPVYESSLTLQVGSINTANKVLDVNDFHEKNDLAKDVEILKSKLLFKRALNRVPIDVTYFNQGDILDHELYTSSPIKVEFEIVDSTVLGIPFYIEFIGGDKFKLKQSNNLIGEYSFNEVINHQKVKLKIRYTSNEKSKLVDYEGDMYFVINDFETLTNSYISRLTVFPLNNNAQTINISFQDNNTSKAKDMVTAIADEYIAYDIEERRKSSKKALEFIADQLDQYYNKVKKSENSIQNFQKTNNFSTLDKSSIYFDRSNKIENELIDVDLQKSVLSEIEKNISVNPKNIDVYELLPILAGTDYAGGIMSLITTLKELLIEKENLQFNVTKDSEAIKSLDHKIEVQKKVLLESIQSSINKLSAKRKELLDKANEIESKFLTVPAKELEYARLQRVLSIDEKFFTLLMEKRTEYSISDAGFVSQHTVLDKASTPLSPVFPNKKMFVLLGVIIGLVLSLILLLAKYILKNTISSVDEIIRYSYAQISVLGIVPKYKKDIPVSQLVVNKNPKSIIAEAFRSIRSNMQFISGKEGKKLLAVTSTISGEGKTFCAINIAGIIAFSGKKVVILDLDMRKPKIHLGFGVENNVGMSTLLIGQSNINESINNSEQEGLDFITSGPIPPNPSELIINGRLEKIIEELKETYDFVIIDNPPIGLVSDAMEVLKKADYPIYVFKNEYSKKYFVNNVDKLMLDNGISNLSVILNSVETGRGSYGYGGYGSGYGGGYGYGGYYEDEPKEKNGLLSRLFGKRS